MIAKLNGVEYQSNHLTKEGDKLFFQFSIPEIHVVLKYKPYKQHILFEILAVRPTTVEEL